ncbi:MAG: substrate-binding domain-containing protein [Defluviitaleaceae bacterium]|nr:substrate-binding domain-containing protein [Defluviitaleaceae bacterium]
MKKSLKWILTAAVVCVAALPLAACGGDDAPTTTTAATNPPTSTNTPPVTTATAQETTADTPAVTGQIAVIAREEGSGTRGAFVEIVDVTIEGNDNTTQEAVVAPGTSIMMTTVAENPSAIGYASTGVALNDARVRVIDIDGVSPTVENMLNGTYPIQRPFIIGYNVEDGLSPLAQDFVDFIFSAQGQEVVANRGYVPTSQNAPDFAGGGLTGTIVVNGSSSVYSLMQHLSEAYREINPDVTIDVHGAGTGHGISAARDGLADIAMSSRDLRESELEFMSSLSIAIDGIAVIVNPDNDIENLSLAAVRNIFLGEVDTWENAR